MRQETIVKTYLMFNELSEDQKKKVATKLWDINVCDRWYDYAVEQFEAKLTKLGFYDSKVEFSGFWSQGDGASFTAKHKRGIVYKQGRYSHSNTMRCDESEILLAVAKRLADRFYAQLDREYIYLTSAEAIYETIIANEYEFDSETLHIA